jgi:hypothetical protein
MSTAKSTSPIDQPQNPMSTISCTGGFVAGTLIHTEQGLRPLAQLCIGDKVLVAQEDGTPVFSPILHLQPCKDKDVILLEFINEELQASGELIVQPDHLFWVEPQGWTTANQLTYGMRIKRFDHRSVAVVRTLGLFCTEEADIACNFDQSDFTGPTVDLRQQSIQIYYEGLPNAAVTSGNIEPFTTSTISIEVDGHSSFYVGTLGLLVQAGMPTARRRTS